MRRTQRSVEFDARLVYQSSLRESPQESFSIDEYLCGALLSTGGRWGDLSSCVCRLTDDLRTTRNGTATVGDGSLKSRSGFSSCFGLDWDGSSLAACQFRCHVVLGLGEASLTP
ncbi:hypothetical protein [Prochlorococcus sp. MIT 1323]|uniref:hypothetical protein n=1 Tax=Prochlorococcus sp. MIT 1323 TaxID=3082526 RepID=UPI0039B422F1